MNALAAILIVIGLVLTPMADRSGPLAHASRPGLVAAAVRPDCC